MTEGNLAQGTINLSLCGGERGKGSTADTKYMNLYSPLGQKREQKNNNINEKKQTVGECNIKPQLWLRKL